MRLLLRVAYLGGPWRGWQSQPGGGTVQDALEAAAAAVAGHRVAVHGAGRTDAGVHAAGQCAHCDVDSSLPPARWTAALNAHLPPGIRVLACRRAPAGFHARFSATGKIYRYRIWNDPVFSPFEEGRAWHVPQPLDLGRMREGLARLRGRHDFAAFAANRGREEPSTVREITAASLARRGPAVELTFRGEGFLYKMVRLMTGALVRCGLGKADPEWIAELLEKGGAQKCQHVAPPDGLTLLRVLYARPGRPAPPADAAGIP